MSSEEMRRTWAVVDVLTSSKRRTKQPPPTAALIRRKYDALSLPALDTLCSVMVHTIAIEHGRFSPCQICGMAQAVRCFPDETAAEVQVAHVHACNEECHLPRSRQPLPPQPLTRYRSFVAGHVLRIGLSHLAAARKRGMPLFPIVTDLPG